MKVLFRTDASPSIGGGHARRCRALADSLGSLGADCRFAVRDLGVDFAKLGVRADQILVLPQISDVASDAAATIGAVAEHDFAPELVIVDHYELDAQWHRAVRAATQARIAVIDDLADRPLDCDVLIDHNWHVDHAQKYASVLERGDTTLLAGPRYALLDPNFADAALAPAAPDVASIGVFMGAADAAGATALVLKGIAQANFSGSVEVVATSANPHLDDLRARIAANPKWLLTTDLPDLAQFMARHGLQIGAGGGATWERCAAGAPTIAAITADNQRASLPALAENGVLHLHSGDPVDPAKLAAEIDALTGDQAARSAFAAEARKLVDGRGALRAAAALSSLHLRPAKTADAEHAYAWRNAPETRRLSADPAEIDWPTHQEWWGKAVTNPDRHLLIVTLGTRDVGVLRFDIAADGSATVSIYFDPAATGLGLGTRTLEAGRQWLAHHEPRAETMTAQIDDRNAPSLAIFRRAGFAPVGGLLYARPIKGPSGAIE